jgi:hypothetical protein
MQGRAGRHTCEELEGIMRRGLNRDQPGWTAETYICPACHDYHDIISTEKQLGLGEEGPRSPSSGTGRRMPSAPAGAPVGWCVWHETASPKVEGPCAYCGTSLHVHEDAIAHVTKGDGATRAGWLVQKCPACHKANAVHPTYAKGVVETSKLDGDSPVEENRMLH